MQRRAAFWLAAYGLTILLPGAVVGASAVVALARGWDHEPRKGTSLEAL